MHTAHLSDTICFLWDEENPVAEVDTVSVKAAYTYYPGSLSPHSMTRGGNTYYYLNDEAGNITALLKSDGTVPQTHKCNPFGAPCTSVSGGIYNPFSSLGQHNDTNTALIYLRNRYYYPGLRRFISEDPLGIAGGINPYVYAENDPINDSDPLGLQPARCEMYFEQVPDDPETAIIEGPILRRRCVPLETLRDVDFRNPFSSRFGQRGTPGLGSTPAFGSPEWVQWASGATQPAAFDPAAIVTTGAIAGAAVGVRAGVSRATGWFAAARAQGLARGGAVQLGQTVFKFGIHEAHHTFPVIGRAVHFQVNWWTPGVRGSGGVFRVPLPWR